MLAISRGLMSRPKIMLLDEPSLGLAPIIVNQIYDLIRQIRDSGITVVMLTGGFMAAGRLDGKMLTLTHTKQAYAAYIGGGIEREAYKAVGRRVVEAVQNHERPLDFITEESFLNVVRYMMATGGSTNSLLHIPAIARQAGVTTAARPPAAENSSIV